MTSTVAPQPNLKLNFNDREYDFSELPPNAQLLLQDMMRIDQQINQLQFELRHLQAARRVYGSSLGKAMSEEAQAQGHEHGGGDSKGSFDGN
jgi:seryl-tRNA synthetase